MVVQSFYLLYEVFALNFFPGQTLLYECLLGVQSLVLARESLDRVLPGVCLQIAVIGQRAEAALFRHGALHVFKPV